MLEILPASKHFRNQSKGHVAVKDGMLMIYLHSRQAVVQWAVDTYTKILARQLEIETLEPRVLQDAIQAVEYAVQAAQRKTYAQHQVLERARARLQALDLPLAA